MRIGTRLPRAACLATGMLVAVLALAGSVAAASPTTATPDPTFVLTGRILNTAGQPIVVSSAEVFEPFADGTYYSAPLDVAADGTFSVALVPAGTSASPVTAMVEAFGPPLPDSTDIPGCVYTYAPAGDVSVSLTGTPPSSPVVVTIEAVSVFQAICTGTASPTITLPPTDTGAPTRSGGRSSDAVVAVLFAMIGAGFIALRASRRPRSRST